MKILLYVLEGIKYLIFADILLSWLMPDRNQVPRSFVVRLTDPLYRPIRELLRPLDTGRIDFSPLVVLLVIIAAQYWIRKRVGRR
jgi:uncharacterized protein YggT (Ycf19 family)